MNIIAIIPARGGSKGIKRKNIYPINNIPLIAYSIIEAKKSKYINSVIISTDDEEISKIARSYSGEVPFLRPKSLSMDNSTMLEVLKHALEWYESNIGKVDAIVLLQPTSPLRKVKHINDCIKLYIEKKPSSVVSIIKVPHHFNPDSIYKLKNGYLESFMLGEKYTRRQDKPLLYARNGPSVLVINPNNIKKNDLYGDKVIPYIMSENESIDIDQIEDLIKVEQIIKKNNDR